MCQRQRFRNRRVNPGPRLMVPREHECMSSLDGLTVLRYGHVYDGGGGMEQYLADLNGILHRRNSFSSVQIQLTSDKLKVGTRSSGNVTTVSLFVESTSH